MTATRSIDVLDQPEPLRGPFLWALVFHVTLLGGLSIYGWMMGQTDAFGAMDAGGSAIGVQAVESIPLARSGPANPVSNDTESQVPQEPVKKPEVRAKQEKVSPKAVPLKMKEKRRPAEQTSENRKFRPFKDLDPNQVFAKQAPQVSNPIYSSMPGSGRIGTSNTTLGTRFPAYAQQIQQMITQKWRTGDVDARLQSAPIVVASFEIMRDGTIRNLKLLQRSGTSTLDFSVQRAITEATPFPPIPPGFERDSATVEFTFELKR